jgi:hypothetical protein
MPVQRPPGYDESIKFLAIVVEMAAANEPGGEARLSAGLRAGLELLASDPRLAHLLLVETLDATRPFHDAHAHQLVELTRALLPSSIESTGLVPYLSARVRAGEAEQLPDAHSFLMDIASPSGGIA